MNSTERLACALIPPLRPPKPETATAARCGSAPAASPAPSRRCGSPNPRPPTAARCGSAPAASPAPSRRVVRTAYGRRGNRSVRDGQADRIGHLQIFSSHP